MNSGWSDPILTCAAARALEARLFGGDEEREWAAMQRAGAGVARAVLTDFREIGGFPDGGRVLVLAGKGHNGGDALLAAKAILGQFPAAQATVLFACGERALRPLAARAWRELASGTGLPTRVQRIHMGQVTHATAYDLCLDGLFGFQFHPPVEAATAEVLRWVNVHPDIRLRAAVDLPSGVGEEAGDITFRADFTYATGSVKAPLLAPRNREAVGRPRYCDLGFFEPTVVGSPLAGDALVTSVVGSPLAGDALVPSRASGLPTDFVLKSSVLSPLAGLRAPQSDKRTFGHLFVIGGSRGYPGAVLMSARAALRSGVGLVTAFVPESLAAAYAACAPEAIWVGWPEAAGGGLALAGLPLLRARLERATALVIGPGLGSEGEALALAEKIVGLADLPIVLDADALQPSILGAAQGRRVICLPHAGEFQRLAGGREATSTGLRAVAHETGATIVLKGPVTRIADGDRVHHSFFGGPVLARGGSGDLLAGLIGGLLAQAPNDPLVAACRGVVWHGLAADLLARDRGQVAVQVTQLLDYLPAALREAAR
jgi:ADP-dependent NAD(P)H-hydrate dehydratase / NAD(P)H-hydrate epimerase